MNALRSGACGARPHGRRLLDSAHTARRWRIHDVARDFRLEDVWELPVRGRREDFPTLLRLVAGFDPSRSAFASVRLLFALRWKIGALLGWDRPAAGVSGPGRTLYDRVPDDLRARTPPAPCFEALPFRPLYVLDDEYAAELANRTMHGVLHIGWVAGTDGVHRGRLAVLVKPTGVRGRMYMAGIRPFRRLVVYPRMLDELSRRWAAEVPPSPARSAGVPATSHPGPGGGAPTVRATNDGAASRRRTTAS